MNIQLLALLFILATTSCMAESPKHQSKATMDRDTVIQSLQRGTSFTSNNLTYQYLPEVRAVHRKSNSESPQQALQGVGATTTQQIETKGQYVLYRDAQRATAQVEQSQGGGSYPTVLNTRTHTFGILPGTIEVKPKNMGDVAAIAAAYGLSVVREFAHLQVVYYQVNPGQDILAVAAVLAADQRVSSAKIEVIEHLAVPN